MTSTEEKPAPIIIGKQSLSDVVLVVDNQEFIAHKLILANRSDVFQAMFFGDFKENKEDRVEIKDVPVNSFRRLLEIIYTGKTSDPLEFLEFPMNPDKHFHIRIGYESSSTDTASSYHYCHSYGKFFHDFWNDTTEILKIADRFNMTSIAKDYFESIIITAMRMCKDQTCPQCLNYLIFAVINGMDLSKCQKKYMMSHYREWINYADEETFPNITIKAMKGLFKHLG